jgi:hypothetical protein
MLKSASTLKRAHWLSLALLSVTVTMFGVGFFLRFFWMQGGGIPASNYVLNAGGQLEFSWYMEREDWANYGFNVYEGNGEIRFSIRNPSGAIVQAVTVDGYYGGSFIASDFGVYRFIFENLDNVNSQTLFLSCLSPDNPFRLTRYEWAGDLMMVAGVFFFCLGLNARDENKSRAWNRAIVLMLIGLVAFLSLLYLNYISHARF